MTLPGTACMHTTRKKGNSTSTFSDHRSRVRERRRDRAIFSAGHAGKRRWLSREGAETMGLTLNGARSLEGSLLFDRSQLLDSGAESRTGQQAVRNANSSGDAKTIRQQQVSTALGQRILALYDEFRPRLFRYICSLNLSRDQAEEVIQETFLRLTTQLMQESYMENVQGWIVRVAHNIAIDLLKRSDRDAAGSPDQALVIERYADGSPNPEQAYSQKEQAQRMKDALANLNPQQRQCFDLRARGFRYKDIGFACGISEQRAAFIVKQAAVRLAATCG